MNSFKLKINGEFIEAREASLFRNYAVTRYRNGKMFSFSHPIAVEEPLELRLDGKPFVTLMRTPGFEKELVVGFCFTEGLIESMSDVLLIEHCGTASESGAQNVASVKFADPDKFKGCSERNIEARTGCGICSRTTINNIASEIPKIESSLTIDIETLSGLHVKMEEAQHLFNSSGATHGAAIFTLEGKLIVCIEDLGRHNALDKVVGYCLMRGIDTFDKIIILSSRTSFELVMKAARAKIPILASVSAPTLFAIELSKKLNCTLVGFLRDEGFNIYTHPERIKAKT